MADQKKLSVEEILAQCRQRDSEGGAGAAPRPAASSEPPAAETPPVEAAPPAAETPAAPPSATPAAPPKKASEMSVADVLAAARAGKAAAAAPSPAAEEAPAKPAAPKPASAAPAAAGKKAGEMSVADVLAAARGGGKPAAAPAAKPAAAAAKPAATKTAAAPVAKAPAAKPAAGGAAAAYDTTSILAAARGGVKPGPISKAEAAAKAAPTAAPAAKPTLPPPPERPAYLDPRPAATAAPSSRRSFFGSFGLLLFGSSLAVGFSSLFVTNLLWLLGLARFMFPNILVEPPTVFKVGFPGDYAPGQVETKYVAQFGVWIVRYEYEGTPQIYALKTVCTHLGCTPNWLEGEQKFKCPCHGSGFYKDGINFEGPAPRPLERYAIRLADDGQLEVDKSRKFQEELGQWSDTSSYVPV